MNNMKQLMEIAEIGVDMEQYLRMLNFMNDLERSDGPYCDEFKAALALIHKVKMKVCENKC